MLKSIEFERGKSRGKVSDGKYDVSGWGFGRWLSACNEFFKYPSPDAKASPSPSRDDGCNGRSMIEMLGVLAIIGVLSVGGIAGYFKAMTRFKVNKTIDEVLTVVSNIRILYANEQRVPMLDYEVEDDSYALVRDYIFPKETDIGINRRFVHAFGGELGFTGDFDNKGIYIWLKGLSREACMALATNDWGGDSSGFAGIEIGNYGSIIDCSARMESYMEDDNTHGVIACRPLNVNTLPLTPTLAAKGCNCIDESCIINLLFEE